MVTPPPQIRTSLLRRLGRQARRIVLAAVLGGLVAATMVRQTPGFGTDEQDLSFALSQQSREALRAERLANANIAGFYLHYLVGFFKGDFGFSHTLNRPVSELVQERLPQTLEAVAYGTAGGIASGLLLALVIVFSRLRWPEIVAGAWTGFFLSIPAAVLALVFLWISASGTIAIALLVSPHVYIYARNLLARSAALPHVMAARARGLNRIRILFMHIVAPVTPQLCAVAGISATLAFGASIPVEVICDIPGIGQLAWKAALGRDMPLVVTITVIVTLMTMVVNAAADLVIAAWPGESHDSAG